MAQLRTLILVAGLLVCAGAARSYPTLAGPTGMGVLPTAAVAPPGVVHLAADYYQAPPYLGMATSAAFPLRASYGVSERLEVGAGYQFTDVLDVAANTGQVNAKYQFPGTVYGARLAGGARYAQTLFEARHERVRTTSVYAVGTRPLFARGTRCAVHGTLGLQWLTQKATVAGTRSALRAFAGAEAVLANGASLATEMQSPTAPLDEAPLYAVTLRYPVAERLTLALGVTNLDPIGVAGLQDSRIFAGMTVTLPAREEPEAR